MRAGDGVIGGLSLPLMGIGNLIKLNHDNRMVNNSLPLMGIGNVRLKFSSPPHTPSHYPSWGLETGSAGTERPALPASHYPSWGLETRVRAGWHGSLSQLITPHGDWKPERGSSYCLAACNSLPLMGIGNASAAGPRPPAGRSHYPSWGLETVSHPEDHGAAVLLITPHGDWKQYRVPLRWRWPRSHYPSWGLETGLALRMVRRVPVLITPHGDWKPEGDNFTDTTAAHSLPLMGIGNRR